MTKSTNHYKIKLSKGYGDLVMRNNKKGQALVEYVLIIALISVIVIGIINTFGGYIKDSITKTSCNISDKEYVEGKNPGDGYCK